MSDVEANPHLARITELKWDLDNARRLITRMTLERDFWRDRCIAAERRIDELGVGPAPKHAEICSAPFNRKFV